MIKFDGHDKEGISAVDKIIVICCEFLWLSSTVQFIFNLTVSQVHSPISLHLSSTYILPVVFINSRVVRLNLQGVLECTIQ